jgi:hypothetical protein
VDGYIKLHRKILENPIVCKDSDYFSVWAYLLLNATHKEYPALFKGQKIIMQPGQLITGRKSIHNQFKSISESKIKRILLDLESDQQIDRQRSNQNSLITILNWNTYQQSDQPNGQPMTSERPASDQPVTTNKNVKNVKNINNKEYQKKYSDDSFEMKCVNYILQSIKAEMPNAKLPDTDEQVDKWCDSIGKMIRLDKREQTDIWNTLVFARTDVFWKVNIRSTNKFREKYETLYLQSKSKKQSPQPKTRNKFNQFPQREYSGSDYQSLEQKLLGRQQ